ncbi:MAG: hypothetical protein ACTTJS_01890 [Wolinella sp.]
MRHSHIISSALVLAFLFGGCSNKRYFEPESVAGEVKFSGKLPSEIISSNREGATLKNGQFITKNGVEDFRLPEGYTFINDSERYFIAVTEQGSLGLFSKNGSEKLEFSFKARPLSAKLEGDMLALVLADNTLVLHDISNNKQLFAQESERALALNALIASPFFLRDLVLFPTLDGKLVVVDKASYRAIRNIVVNSDEFFNNVIFLDVLNNRLVAATPKRIISVSPEVINTYNANIRDVIFVRDRIYILTTEGQIILADQDLNVMRSKKFPFAHFSGALHGKYIYAVETQGYFVAVDVDLLDANVYEIPSEIDKPLFANENRIYFDDHYFELNR